MMKPGESFPFLANRLCLDFVNTEAAAGGGRVDRLASYADLVRWGRASGALTVAEAREAGPRWADAPDGERALEAAREFRGVLRALAERLAAGRPAPAEALEAVNAVLRNRPGFTQVAREGVRVVERWLAPLRDPADVLAPVALSAARMLAEDAPALVRKCESPPCLNFFYDVTKNHARRWCSMETCGNRAKAAAFYRRKVGGA
ncbi:MAG: hypothetical protein JWM27_2841 [Gemmatimonadetes bacterium]|nr:hypothetical protein [Gemmatimonadota bacterium]